MSALSIVAAIDLENRYAETPGFRRFFERLLAQTFTVQVQVTNVVQSD
jgi:hypothetical protein